MEIAEKYSHINSEEYLIVHQKLIYEEVKDIIHSVNASKFKVKASNKEEMQGESLYNPKGLKTEFKRLFSQRNWEGKVNLRYYVTTDYPTMQKLTTLPLDEQKKLLVKRGVRSPIYSSKQIDFTKSRVGMEVQFGAYDSVAYDLFIRFPLFYKCDIIDVGIEILPMKSMQSEMPTEIAYYEGEVYNVLRHGRNNPPVPLLIMGVAP